MVYLLRHDASLNPANNMALILHLKQNLKLLLISFRYNEITKQEKGKKKPVISLDHKFYKKSSISLPQHSKLS